MVSVYDFLQPFYNLHLQGSDENPKEVPLIVIGWEPQNKGEPNLDPVRLEQLFFGPTKSVANWFEENSQGRFRLVPHPTQPIVGPFQSLNNWTFYWRNNFPTNPADWTGTGITGLITFANWQRDPFFVPPPPNSPNYWLDDKGKAWFRSNEGFIHGHLQSWVEAIRMASNVIDFSDFDRNGDGNLTNDECLINVVKAQRGGFGTALQSVCGQEVPAKIDLEVNGVKIKGEICETYAAPPHTRGDLAVAIEETLHLAAHLADAYPDPRATPSYRSNNDSRRPGQLSLTDAGGRPVHVDPYHKLKWGWLNPQLVDHSGTYTLRDVATTGDALILYSPYFSTEEFFILENRWRGNSTYDRFRDDPDQDGLALWHCIQDPELENSWARRALHLRRVDPDLDATNAIKYNLTLFDGKYASRSYDLHDDSSPQNLRFQNGMPSRIRIRNISRAGSTMNVWVEVPPKPGEIAVSIGHVKMIRVHNRGTGYGPSAYRLNEDCVFTMDSEPGTTFGIDLVGTNAPVGRKMFDLLQVAFKNHTRVRIEYLPYCAMGGRVIRIIES